MGQPCRTRHKLVPASGELEDGDGSGGELGSHALEHARRFGATHSNRADRPGRRRQRERQFRYRGIMPDDQESSRARRDAADQVKKLHCRRLIIWLIFAGLVVLSIGAGANNIDITEAGGAIVLAFAILAWYHAAGDIIESTFGRKVLPFGPAPLR
jgi:hypothetical protein